MARVATLLAVAYAISAVAPAEARSGVSPFFRIGFASRRSARRSLPSQPHAVSGALALQPGGTRRQRLGRCGRVMLSHLCLLFQMSLLTKSYKARSISI